MHIQRQFKLFYSFAQDQKYLLRLFLKREIERAGFVLTKSSEGQLKTLGIKLQVIPQDKLEVVIKKFIQKCKYQTQEEFWTWRQKIKDLLKANCYDERMNVRQPMAATRAVWSLDDVGYQCEPPLSDNMRKFLERMHDDTLRPYPPYLKKEVFDEAERSELLQKQYDSQVEEGRRLLMSER